MKAEKGKGTYNVVVIGGGTAGLVTAAGRVPNVEALNLEAVGVAPANETLNGERTEWLRQIPLNGLIRRSSGIRM